MHSRARRARQAILSVVLGSAPQIALFSDGVCGRSIAHTIALRAAWMHTCAGSTEDARLAGRGGLRA